MSSMSSDIVFQVAQVKKDVMKSWLLSEMVSLMGPLVDLLFVKFTHKVSSTYRQQQLIDSAGGGPEPTVNPNAVYSALPNQIQGHQPQQQQQLASGVGGPEPTVNPPAVYSALPNHIQGHQPQQQQQLASGVGGPEPTVNPSAVYSALPNQIQGHQPQQQQQLASGVGGPEPTVNPTAVYSGSPNLSQVRQEQQLVGGGGELAPKANPESAFYSASPNPVQVSHQQQQLVGGGAGAGGGPEPTVNPSAVYSALPNQIQVHQSQQQQQLVGCAGGGVPEPSVNPTASYSGPPNIQSNPSTFAICLPSQSPTERVAIDWTIEIDHPYPAQTNVQYSTGLDPEDAEETLREVKREIFEEEKEMRRIAAQEMPFAGNDSISFNQEPSGQAHIPPPQSHVSSGSMSNDRQFQLALVVSGIGLSQNGSNCALGREMYLGPPPGQVQSQPQSQTTYSADQMDHSELTFNDNGLSQSGCNACLGENMQDQSSSVLAQKQQQTQTSSSALTMEQMPNTELTCTFGNSDNGHSQSGRNFALGSDPQSPSGDAQPQTQSSQVNSRSSTTGHLHHNSTLTVTDNALSRSGSNRALGRKNSQPPCSDHQINPKKQSQAKAPSLASDQVYPREATAAAAGNGETPSSSNRAQGRKTNRQQPPAQVNAQSHANARSLATDQVNHSEAATAAPDNGLLQSDCSRSLC